MTDEKLGKKIDAHFTSRGAAPSGDWRTEVAASPKARRRYARWLLLAKLDRRQASAEERIGRALGLGRPRRSGAQWVAGLGVATAVAMALLVVLPRGDEGFQARGGGAAFASELRIFRVEGGAASVVEPDATIARGDELAFAYRNPLGRVWLLVFAVDAAGNVYWFHPAWTDAAEEPLAIPATHSEELVELPSATSHEWSASPVTVHAWLSDQRRSVQEVEAVLKGGPLSVPSGDVLLRQTLRVAGGTP